MVAKKNNNKRTLLIILSVLILVVILYSVYANNKNDKRIDYTKFTEMVQNEQVSEVYIDDYTIYIKKTDSKIKSKDFPSKYDYYCSYMNNEVVISFIEEYNQSLWVEPVVDGTTGEIIEDGYYKDGYIKYDGQWDTGSWIENALPWISLIILVIVGIVIYRSMSSGGNKGFAFGRSKAKLVVSSKIRFTDF